MMKVFLGCLLLVIQFVSVHNSSPTQKVFNELLQDYVTCIKRNLQSQTERYDFPVKDPGDKYGLEVEVQEPYVDEENADIHSEDILLTYPDQEDVNDGPTPLGVEMQDQVTLTRKETYEELDGITFWTNKGDTKEYNVGLILDDERTSVSPHKSELKGFINKPKLSTRKYKLGPYSSAFVRTNIVRMNATYPMVRDVYLFGNFKILFAGNKKFPNADAWKKCGNGEFPEHIAEDGTHYINIGTITDDVNYLTEDNELVFTLTDKLYKFEEKVVMKINAREDKDKKKTSYQRLCLRS